MFDRDVDDGAGGMAGDGDVVDLVEDRAGGADVLLEGLEDGRGAADDVDTF